MRFFGEAGLLSDDRDHDRKRDRDEEGASRQMSPVYSRSSMDRKQVEVSAASSTWGSTCATPSVVSERVGTPFIYLSSSAPTSATPPLSLPVPSALQQQREDAAVYQVPREKHKMETEALLSVLSDSQSLNKVLREENTRAREENAQLWERLAVLEGTVEVMRRGWEMERERERLNDSRLHSGNHSVYGSLSRSHMSRLASS